jgi:hypothetical protein
MAMKKAKLAEHKLAIRKEYAYFKWCKMYMNKGTDYVEMQEVLDEFEELGIKQGMLSWFKNHFYGGTQDDYFRDEIAVRNRRNYQKKLTVWM